jgi:hypothetical protein
MHGFLLAHSASLLFHEKIKMFASLGDETGGGRESSWKKNNLVTFEYHIFRISTGNFLVFMGISSLFFREKIQQNVDECLTQLMREISNLR